MSAADILREHHLDVTVDLDDGMTVPARREAAQIIIGNLIDNAVRYTPRGGRIAIRREGTANGSPT
jgi:signal transduction histidine kinase